MLPGWYGFAAAVDGWQDAHAEGRAAAAALMTEMHARWPFFRAVLSNMAMVLAKTDLAIASRYAELYPDAASRAAIFGRIESEHVRAVHHVLAITGQDGLLSDNPTLERSIRNRFPYLDPLNHLQVELLRRYRAGQTDERTQRAIHLTINGLAAGLRNSGSGGASYNRCHRCAGRRTRRDSLAAPRCASSSPTTTAISRRVSSAWRRCSRRTPSSPWSRRSATAAARPIR
jgi:hypothetical protein